MEDVSQLSQSVAKQKIKGHYNCKPWLTYQNKRIEFGVLSRVVMRESADVNVCFISPASLCVLVPAFTPVMFKAISDMYVPFTIFLIVLGLFCVGLSLAFPAQRSSFSICCKAGLVVLNSLSFCLSEKLFISPSILNEILQ